ncbi:hypothetical protein ACR9YC_07070 [Parasphingorhabdus sp. DH2-15]|uniref:hypothetical protein n=1 Tax=Parasphingorhabdus sp. DH2-15 TaxID=3444112 RepID=UPI003F687B89
MVQKVLTYAVIAALTVTPLTWAAPRQTVAAANADRADYQSAERQARAFLLELLAAKPDKRLMIAEREQARTKKGAKLDTRIMRIIATGAVARRISSRQSIRRGYPGAMRSEIDTLMESNANLSWVRTLDALWHFEVLRRAGGFGGAIIGASKSKGLDSARYVVAANDFDDGLGLAIASGLAGHDARQHKALIKTALQPALKSKNTVIRKAASTLNKLMGEDYGAAAQYARALI